MYIMCVILCLFSALSRSVAALQLSIIIIIMKVHGCMVYTERAKTVAVSRGTSHVTTEQRCKKKKPVDIQQQQQQQ